MTATWGYEGRRVIVSGGGGAGMGAAAVRHLSDLGAEVHVLDLKEPPVEVSSYQAVDLRDPDATTAAVERIGGPVRRAVQLRRAGRVEVPRPRCHAGQLRGHAPPGRGGVRPHGAGVGHRQHFVHGGVGLPGQHRKVDDPGPDLPVSTRPRNGARTTPRRSPAGTVPRRRRSSFGRCGRPTPWPGRASGSTASAPVRPTRR